MPNPTGFVKRGFGVGVWEGDRILNPIATITIYDQDGNEIGYVTSISPSTTRNVTRQRHFNAADAGRVVELTHNPEDYKLTLEGFLLYHPGYNGLISGSLIDRLFRPEDDAHAVFELLNKQYIPFDIVEESINPATGRGYRKIYISCKISDWSGDRRLTQAWVAEKVTVVVSNEEYEKI